MAISNYPNGFPSGVTMRGLPITQAHPGKAFWVSNVTTGLLQGQRGGSNQNKGDFNSPFSTIAGALAQCVANRGDIIFVKPGHAETVVAAGLALNVAGVAIIGLGVGDARPTITLAVANTATITVSAANVAIQNIKFVANFLSIAACFTLTTAKNFTLWGCSFSETSAILNFLNIVKSTGAANTVDGLMVSDCTWNGLGTTSVNAFILSANDIDGLTVLRNRVKKASTVDAAMVIISAGIVTNAILEENRYYSAQTATSGGSLINVGGTTSTGWVVRNYAQTLTTSSDKLFTVTVGLGAFENRVSGAVGATGFVIPAVDT